MAFGFILYDNFCCCIPGQDAVLHRCDCIFLPSQVVPQLQVLVRVLVPLLEAAFHIDQVVHEVKEALDPPPE